MVAVARLVTNNNYPQSQTPATPATSPDTAADVTGREKLFQVFEGGAQKAPGKARKALFGPKRKPQGVTEGLPKPPSLSGRAGLGCPYCGAGEPRRSSSERATVGREGRARAGETKEKRTPGGVHDPRQVAFDWTAGNEPGEGPE